MPTSDLSCHLPSVTQDWPLDDHRWIPWSDLPAETQTCLKQYAQSLNYGPELLPEGLWARPQALADLPEIPEADGVTSREPDAPTGAHALAVSLQSPMVISRGKWLSGHPQVHRARAQGQTWGWALDLTGEFAIKLWNMAGQMDKAGHLGEVKTFHDHVADCFEKKDAARLKTLVDRVPNIHWAFQAVLGRWLGNEDSLMEVWASQALGIREDQFETLTGVENPLRHLAELAPTDRLERYAMVLMLFIGDNLDGVNPRVLRRLMGQFSESDQKALLIYGAEVCSSTQMRSLDAIKQAWLGATERVQRVTWPLLLLRVMERGRVDALVAYERWGQERGWSLPPSHYEHTVQEMINKRPDLTLSTAGLSEVFQYGCEHHHLEAYPIVKTWLRQLPPINRSDDPWDDLTDSLDSFLVRHLDKPTVQAAVDRAIEDGHGDHLYEAAAMRRSQRRHAHIDTMHSPAVAPTSRRRYRS